MGGRNETAFASGAWKAITVGLTMAGLCGCTALMPDMNGLAEPGNVLNGYMTARSTIELNHANVQLSRAQALLTTQQAIDIEVKREELKKERATTVGILRDMAAAGRQPLFDDLAQWVAAGGDPDYAMKYALTHQGSPAPRPNRSSPAPEFRPTASRPDVSPVAPHDLFAEGP